MMEESSKCFWSLLFESLSVIWDLVKSPGTVEQRQAISKFVPFKFMPEESMNMIKWWLLNATKFRGFYAAVDNQNKPYLTSRKTGSGSLVIFPGLHSGSQGIRIWSRSVRSQGYCYYKDTSIRRPFPPSWGSEEPLKVSPAHSSATRLGQHWNCVIVKYC